MESFLEEPVVIYLALVLATALTLVEVALPTFGVAGALALVLLLAGIWGIDRQGLVWWPLLLSAAGVTIWAVLLVTKRPNVTAQVAAAASFATGSVLFAVWAEDLATLVAALASSALLPIAFPVLQRQAHRLMERPPDVGMESMVGRHGKVVSWSGTEGSVMVHGSYWNAVADRTLEPGDRVVVESFSGMSLFVSSPPADPGHPEPTRQAHDDTGEGISRPQGGSA